MIGFAKPGDKIYDEAGKLVATVQRDLVRGQPPLPEDFEFHDGHLPKAGEPLPRAIALFLLWGGPSGRRA
jgi:hypothetical protein